MIDLSADFVNRVFKQISKKGPSIQKDTAGKIRPN
jgi:hypothetical protein